MDSEYVPPQYRLLAQFATADWNKHYLKSTGERGTKCGCYAGRILSYLGLRAVARKFFQSDQEAGIAKIKDILKEFLADYHDASLDNSDDRVYLPSLVVESVARLEEKVYGKRWDRYHDWDALLPPWPIAKTQPAIPKAIKRAPVKNWFLQLWSKK